MPFTTHAQSFFDYPRSADFVVIEYSQIITMLEDQDPTPLLRIYGDGRVLVHQPAHTSHAGDYEMKLNDAELHALITSLEQKGLFSYDNKKVAQLKQQTLQKNLAGPQIAIAISDDTYTVIKINLSTYMPTISGTAITNFKKDLKLKNISWQAKDYPNVVEIKNAAKAREQLRAFLKHPQLNSIIK